MGSEYKWPGTDNRDRCQRKIRYGFQSAQCPGCLGTDTVDVEIRPGFVRRDCNNCLAPPLRYKSGRLVDPSRSAMVRIPHFVCWVVWNGEPVPMEEGDDEGSVGTSS